MMRGDTVKQALDENYDVLDELGVALPDGIEQMLQGQDLVDYQALRQAEERKSWLRQRGLTEDDVYGRHANPRPIEPGDTLARLIIQPKGMITEVLTDGAGTVIREDTHRDPRYVGEHRAVEGWAGDA